MYYTIIAFHAQFDAKSLFECTIGERAKRDIIISDGKMGRGVGGGCTSGSLDCRSLVRATFSIRRPTS